MPAVFEFGVLFLILLMVVLAIIGTIEEKRKKNKDVRTYFHVVYDGEVYDFDSGTGISTVIEKMGTPLNSNIDKYGNTVLNYQYTSKTDRKVTVRLYFKNNRLETFATFNSHV